MDHMKKWMQVLILVLFLTVSQFSIVAAQDPVVRIILYYSPACGHCHKIISEDLPILIDQYGGETEILFIPPIPEEETAGSSLVGIYGDSIEILYVNTMTELGHGLYRALVELLSIPPELQAVPTMVVGENLLIGGNEIPARLPGIIEEALANDGIDWIDLPGLTEAIDQLIELPEEPAPTDEPTQEETQAAAPTEDNSESIATQVPQTATSSSEDPTADSFGNPTSSLFEPKLSVLDRVKMDPIGNSAAIVVLIGMVISIAIVGSRLIFPESIEGEQLISWLIPMLSVIGIGVATYLTYVEASGAEAVCGPVGDCNTVQESKYAFLFGIIPIGAIGLVGYVAIILAWLVARFGKGNLVQWSKVALLGMTLFGTLFSIYLTFLEPFVIGATCSWCVTSAIFITTLMWLSIGPGTDALARLRGEGEEITS